MSTVNADAQTVKDAMAADGKPMGEGDFADMAGNFMTQHAAPAAEPAAPVAEPATKEPIPADQLPPVPDIPEGPSLPGDVSSAIQAEDPLVPSDEEVGVEAPQEVKDGDEKAVSAWAHLKRDNKTKDRRIQDLEDQVRQQELERESRPDIPVEEIAQLKQQVVDYEEKIGRLDLSQTKAFKDRYDSKLADLAVRGAQTLQQAGRDESSASFIMQQLIQTNGDVNQIQEILAEEQPMIQSAMLNVVNEILAVGGKRAQALEDWKATRAVLQDGVERGDVASTAAAVVEYTKSGAQQLEQEDSWIFRESSEDLDWNEQRHDIIRGAQRVLVEGDNAEIARYVMEGFASSRYRKLFEVSHARCQKLETELQRRISKAPGLGAAPVAPAVTPAGGEAGGPVEPGGWLDGQISQGALPVRHA
jgi:hypothetical protein